MALKEDLLAGLAALSEGTPQPLTLDDAGQCEIPMRLPPSITQIAGGKLPVLIKLARSGRFFTMLVPIAVAPEEPPARFMLQLLNDQLFVDTVRGVSFSYNLESGAIFATYHWMVETISPSQFCDLFHKFVAAAFTLLDRMGAIADGMKGISTLRNVEIR
jgi:hypothetical protein